MEFDDHLARLISSLMRDLEDSAHHPSFEGEDDIVCLVKSRGLEFVPCTTAEIALEQGPRAPITEIISRVFTGLELQHRVFNPELQWMKASFTSQTDRTYAGHIRTRREAQRVEFAAGSYRWNTLIAHLPSAFPGHVLPKPGANTDRKEERMESREGAEAGVAAGSAVFHAGDGAEGNPQNVSHGASAGAGPLPARQTTIVWPVVRI